MSPPEESVDDAEGVVEAALAQMPQPLVVPARVLGLFLQSKLALGFAVLTCVAVHAHFLPKNRLSECQTLPMRKPHEQVSAAPV